jgi:hypothetical protein
VSHTLRNGRVDGILANVTLDSKVVGIGALVLLERAALDLVLVCRVPRPQNHLTATAHGLRVRGHHADGAEIVEYVLGGNGLGADTRLGKGNIFRNVL